MGLGTVAIVAISIHAPARGATKGRKVKEMKGTISIHAPARGATFDDAGNGGGRVDFNPRSRKGSDEMRETKGEVP